MTLWWIWLLLLRVCAQEAERWTRQIQPLSSSFPSQEEEEEEEKVVFGFRKEGRKSHRQISGRADDIVPPPPSSLPFFFFLSLFSFSLPSIQKVLSAPDGVGLVSRSLHAWWGWGRRKFDEDFTTHFAATGKFSVGKNSISISCSSVMIIVNKKIRFYKEKNQFENQIEILIFFAQALQFQTEIFRWMSISLFSFSFSPPNPLFPPPPPPHLSLLSP